jgi:serine/threonine protein phosphatase PrpC
MSFDVAAEFERMVKSSAQPQQAADDLMAHALKLEQNRPGDDISIVVIGVLPRDADDVRRMWLRVPLS